jgi:hypothetical protein
VVARQALAWRGGPEPRKSLIVKDLHSPNVISVTLNRPALILADNPWAGAIHCGAVDRGELTARVDERHTKDASGGGCGAKEIIFFDCHDYNLTKKIVLSTVFLKKIKKILDYISY